MLKKLAIISTHPIQYNAPLFALLSKREKIQVKVFYTWGVEVLKKKFDPGFNINIEWDIPLLDKYEFVFVKNVAKDKGSHHFKGIDNPALINMITRWGADAVLIYGWSFKSHLKAIRHFSGKIPVLFRGDSTSLRVAKGIKKLARDILLHWVYHYVDFCFYVGTHNKNYFIEHGVKNEQLVFAPHAIDNERFKATSSRDNIEKSARWKQSLGIGKEDMVFLYAGKLDHNKNVVLLAEAFIMLGRTEIHLILAGEGLNKIALENIYAKHGNIHFLPFQNQSQMPLLYALADVFVLPSLSETWGLALNEAMACGKAVLASDGCGAAIDLVVEGENGYIFRSKNSSDLQEKLLRMVNDIRRVKQMGLKSSVLIEKWNYEVTCDALEQLI